MEYSSAIETIGSITKMENLQSIDNNTLENSLVLKNINTFPGFKFPNNTTKPASIFIILRFKYDPEKINRILQELTNKKIVNRYPSQGEIITQNALLPCIRFKSLPDFSYIPVLQDFLTSHDLQLMPFQSIDCNARIKLFKTFKIIEIYDGIYRDLIDGEKIYIKIPNSLNWRRLEHITKKIKYNLTDKNFDAALGVIYRFCGAEDVVRIYDSNKTLERALLLKKNFINEIKNEFKLEVHKLHHN
jgi:hypothetical protein